jgi:hypothetical protein
MSHYVLEGSSVRHFWHLLAPLKVGAPHALHLKFPSSHFTHCASVFPFLEEVDLNMNCVACLKGKFVMLLQGKSAHRWQPDIPFSVEQLRILHDSQNAILLLDWQPSHFSNSGLNP